MPFAGSRLEVSLPAYGCNDELPRPYTPSTETLPNPCDKMLMRALERRIRALFKICPVHQMSRSASIELGALRFRVLAFGIVEFGTLGFCDWGSKCGGGIEVAVLGCYFAFG